MTHRLSVVFALLLGLGSVAAGQSRPVPQSSGGTQTTGSGMVTGRVVDTAGAPVASAVVGISGSTESRGGAPSRLRVITDAEGRFFFRDLLPGSYNITSSKPGWLPGALGRRRPGGSTVPLDLGEGGRLGALRIVMWKAAVISGRVTDEDGDPLVGFEIRVIPQVFVAGRRQSGTPIRAKSDDRGMYRFPGLSPGDYLVAMPVTVITEPSTFAGAIRGAGATPAAYLQTMTAVGAAPMVFDRAEGVTASDKLLVGSLSEMTGMPTAQGPWLMYPTTYFPSATAIGSATIVRTLAGEDRSGVDLKARLTPTYQVSGVVTGPDGAAAFHAVHLLAGDSADAPLFDVATAVTDTNGTFTFHGVPRGQYVARIVRIPLPSGEGFRLGLAGGTGQIPFVALIGGGPSSARPRASPEPVLHASELVTVADRSVRNVNLLMRPAPRVSGRAQFDGTATKPTPEQLRDLPVVLEPAGGGASSFGPFVPGGFGDDGRFTTSSPSPGRYVIRAGGALSGWTFKGATYQGRDVSETPIDILTDLDDVVITFADADRLGKIDGTVQSPDGQVDGTSVLLFPVDPSGWMDYGRTTRRVRSVTASAAGAFTIPAPPAGAYYLIAIPDEQSADWQNPATLAKLAALAERVQISDGGSVTRSLTLRRMR